MMRLNDPLTTSFEYEGVEYAIDLSFDNVLDVFDVLDDSDMFPAEKVNMCLELLISDFEKFQGTTEQQFLFFEHILQNYVSVGDGAYVETDRLGNPMPNVTEKKVISLTHDAKYIYASFRQIGINLFDEQGKLSWEEFQALLESLPDDTILSKVIQIRSWEPSKGESAKEKERMRKLQQKYALPTDEEVGDEFGS